MDKFKRSTLDGFNYVYERSKSKGNPIKNNETVVVRMPRIAANQRGVNDIGWQCDSEYVLLYATFSENPESESAMWTIVPDGNAINKTITALMIRNTGRECSICIRAILC